MPIHELVVRADRSVSLPDLATAIRDVQSTPTVLDVFALAEVLADTAVVDRGSHTVRRLRWMIDAEDQLSTIAGVHALSRVPESAADSLLSELLSDERSFLREHATWVLAARRPRLDAVGRLVSTLVSGGFVGFLAQRTLERWAPTTPDHVALALEGALAGQSDPLVRGVSSRPSGSCPASWPHGPSGRWPLTAARALRRDAPPSQRSVTGAVTTAPTRSSRNSWGRTVTSAPWRGLRPSTSCRPHGILLIAGV